MKGECSQNDGSTLTPARGETDVNRAPRDGSVRWWLWPACFLFFLMMVFPTVTTLISVKQALFLFLLAAAIIQGIRRVHLHPTVVAWTVLLSAASLIFAIWGMVMGAPGAFTQLKLYAIWPLVYLVLLSGIRSIPTLQSLEKTMVFSTVFAAVVLAVFIPSQLGFLPEIPGLRLLILGKETDAGTMLAAYLNAGYVFLGFPTLTSYMFLVPFVIAALIDRWRNKSNVWVGKIVLLGALLLTLPIVILSGRRGLQLVTMLAPLLTLALGMFGPTMERRRLIKSFGRSMTLILGVLVGVFWFLNSANLVTVEGFSERFTSGFDFSPSNRGSAVDRIEQYPALMDGWKQSPWIGKGLGAVAHRSIRSNETPWSYELGYPDLLLQAGLIGFALYASGIAWIYWVGIRIIRSGGEASRFMLPALVGLATMLIAHGTNPVLVMFDTIWGIFVPLAFINHWLLDQNEIKKV